MRFSLGVAALATTVVVAAAQIVKARNAADAARAVESTGKLADE